jgi:hypothetical protein
VPISPRFPLLCIAALVALTARPVAHPETVPTSEIDAFMAQVLARRDDNWKKLQQYVLDERERAELLGPGRVRLYGLARDYTWYIRDGAFVRSPVRFDGVELSEDERRKYEREYLERDAQRAKEQAAKKDPAAPLPADAGAPTEADTLARLTREPQFVSAAYFLRFKFEPGHYAFAGRETYEGTPVYKIEYYPARLFNDDEPETADSTAGAKKEKAPHDEHGKDPADERIERQMNKVALVTLWIEPTAHQVLRYTFQNIGMDFLPGRSVIRIDDLQASMRMREAFPHVWLPRGIEGQGSMTLASGTYTVRYRTEYENYREATVKARIR